MLRKKRIVETKRQKFEVNMFRIANKNYGLALGMLLLAGMLSACSESNADEQENREEQSLPRVLVVTTEAEALSLSRSYAARTQGSKEVTVRARASGMLKSREYQEGELVSEGDLLFTIEPTEYDVALQRAEAELQRAQAELNDAERQWDRIKLLFDEGAVSQRDRDQGLANLELAQANYAAIEASAEEARINLGYTQVKSPITGIVGREQYSVGNIISEGDTLTTMAQLDPLYVYFSVPQNDLAAQYLLQQVSVNGDTSKAPHAEIERNNGSRFEQQGVIDFISRSVDSETGTINVRARIPNPEAEILPGQFTRVHIPDIRLEQAIAIPQRALVQSGQQAIVYVVNEQNQTEMREVVVGPRIGDRFVISVGLSTNERVVVEGLTMLRPGIEVRADPYTGDE